MEEDQRELHEEMLVELIDYVRADRAAKAKAARDAEQASQTLNFLPTFERKRKPKDSPAKKLDKLQPQNSICVVCYK